MIDQLSNIWTSLSDKKRQNIKGIIFVGIGSIILVAIMIYAKPKQDDNLLKSKTLEKETKYQLPENLSSVEDKWLLESRNEIDELQKEDRRKKEELDRVNRQLVDLSQKLDSIIQNDETDELRNRIEELINIQNNLNEDLKKKETSKYNPQNNSSYKKSRSNTNLSNDPFSRSGGRNRSQTKQPETSNLNSNVPETRSILVVNFGESEEQNTYDTSNYLPAGSYAKAILISAVDASVGISSQADPRQVLFRVTSNAISALKDNNEPMNIDINGCLVTGAALGDLSSERAYIRLLKMTCSAKGQMIETNIEGYAADSSDGKSGIVGRVVSREGDLITKSFLAGMVSGVGSGLTARFQEGVTFSDSFTTTNSITERQIIGQGLGEGIESSSSSLEEYFIQRAEQYQPVISIASGKEVELVFISGTYLDGRVQISNTENDNQK